MDKEEYENLKNNTRWKDFSHWELQMIRYGLSQIYDHTPKDSVNSLLKELNDILSPKELERKTTD